MSSFRMSCKNDERKVISCRLFFYGRKKTGKSPFISDVIGLFYLLFSETSSSRHPLDSCTLPVGHECSSITIFCCQLNDSEEHDVYVYVLMFRGIELQIHLIDGSDSYSDCMSWSHMLPSDCLFMNLCRMHLSHVLRSFPALNSTFVARSIVRKGGLNTRNVRQCHIQNTMTTESAEPALDKERFKKKLLVPCLTVEKQKLNDVLRLVKYSLFKCIKYPAVRDDEENDATRNILLDPKRIKTISDLGPDVSRKLETLCQGIDLQFKEVELRYENMNAEDVLKEILPEEILLSSFSIIGHIAHLNLKPYHLPYKHIIGQVLLDKLKPTVRLVVNKTSSIDDKFRVFPMEVLAQDSDDVSTLVETKQENCVFKFDFAKVYWNPRLDTEHNRIISKLRSGMDVAYDVFAGVGPFSIPLAKKKCKTLANDLNPDSFKWLQYNAQRNKVTSYHSEYNMDGGEFIRQVVRDDIVSEWQVFDSGDDARMKQFHVIMNLPASAVHFLDHFIGWLDEKQEEVAKLKSYTLPTVHCYTFMKGIPAEDAEQAVVRVVESRLQAKLNILHEVKLVRKVSPSKDMYRISFELPLVVCFTEKKSKKLKTE